MNSLRRRIKSWRHAVTAGHLLGGGFHDCGGGLVLRLAGRRLRERAHVLEAVQDERPVRRRVGHVQRGAVLGAAAPVAAQRDEHLVQRAEQDEQLRGQPEHRHKDRQREEHGQLLEQRRRLEAHHPEGEEDVRLRSPNVPFFVTSVECDVLYRWLRAHTCVHTSVLNLGTIV